MIEGEHEALLNSFDQYEISLMVEDHSWHDQSCVAELAGSSSSKIILHVC